MNAHKEILFIFICIISLNVFAQSPEKNLEEWHKQNPIEKIYLQIDRKDYFAGQTSWFKGYFMSGFLPSTRNSTLFVELINKSGNIVAKKVLPVFNAITYGQIDIPDTLSTGTYRLRAYTPLMLNHDKNYLYNTAIRVYGKNNKNKSLTKEAASSHLSFFPEGGTLLAGIENTVAFKATTDKGLPENISTIIKDNSGATIARIKSMHDGMGVFTFTPVANQTYTATFANQTFNLPKASTSGLAIKVKSEKNKINFSWSAAGGDQFEPVYLIGQMQHEIIFKQALNSSTSSETINTSDLHSGILQITFFNKDGMPLAERLIFIDNKEYLVDAVLNKEILNTKARGKNEYSIHFANPIDGNFSVSITDDEYNEPGARKENIISSLLLTSDIPGYVHHPSFYFSDNNQANQALDLVMLTNGWRRFNWKEMAQSKPVNPLYTDPGYISLSGKVNVRGSKKSFAERELLVWVSAADSSRTLQTVKTDEEGRFKMDSVVFFDKAKILFSDVMGDKSKFITVKLNTDSLYKTYNLPTLQMPATVNTNTSLINNLQTAYNSFSRGNGVLLDNVSIEGRRLTLEQLEEKYMSSIFRGHLDARTINLSGEFVPQINIFEWLVGRVPSLSIKRSGQYFDNYKLSFRQQPMQIFLDEMRMDDASFISNIPPNQIALIKIYPQFLGAFGNNTAIAIYTKRWDDLNEEMESSGEIVDYDGYSIIKEFYSPDYTTPPDIDYRDNRLTLNWQPEIIVDSTNKKIPINFYNTDRTKKIKVVAEGITKDGKLLMIEETVSQEDKK